MKTRSLERTPPQKKIGFAPLLVYLDDIIIFGKTFDEHLDRLRIVLKQLNHAGIVKYPGHLIDEKGIRPDPAKC